MTAWVVRLVLGSGLALLGGCQTAGSVYQTYYLPEDKTADATALVRAAEARCNTRANTEAEDAYQRAYGKASINIPQSSGGTTSGNVPGFALSTTESAVLSTTRMARVAARQAGQEAWGNAMQACMAEAGFRQVRVCVSHCAQ
jgi:hypothetical protein